MFLHDLLRNLIVQGTTRSARCGPASFGCAGCDSWRGERLALAPVVTTERVRTAVKLGAYGEHVTYRATGAACLGWRGL